MKTCIEVLAILLCSSIAAYAQATDAQAADMWDNTARAYQMQGRYQEAEALYRRALAAREKLFGPDDPRVAAILNNQGALYYTTGRYAAAESLLRRALTIEEASTSASPQFVSILFNLPAVYREQ